jgi:hypothetical protein
VNFRFSVQSVLTKIFKVKTVSVHVMKAYMGRRDTDLLVLNLSIRWSSVISFTTRPLYLLGKNFWCAIYRRLDGHQGRCVHVGEETNLLPVQGIETPPTHTNTLLPIL